MSEPYNIFRAVHSSYQPLKKERKKNPLGFLLSSGDILDDIWEDLSNIRDLKLDTAWLLVIFRDTSELSLVALASAYF